MATSSIPTSSAARKRTPPSPQRVYETWQHECRTAGEWGAYARTAARYHKPSGEPYSDEWARKLCKRWEAEQQAREAAAVAPIDDTLTYQAPPDGYPHPQPRPALRQPELANSPTSTLKAPTIGADLPTARRDITAAANGATPNRQPANPANFQPFELKETRAAADANRQPGEAEPGHARPDIDVPGAEAPELPPEAFPNPEPNQPPDAAPPRPELPHHDRPLGPSDSPTTDRQSVPDWPTEAPTDKRHYTAEHPRPVPLPPGPPEPEPSPSPDPAPVPPAPLYQPQRVIVRVPEPRQVGGLVGWIASGPMLGPVPVWALLLLAFGMLLVQLGLLG